MTINTGYNYNKFFSSKIANCEGSNQSDKPSSKVTVANKNIECESILKSFVDCLEENSFNITSEYRCYDIVNKYRKCLCFKHL